jgi:hypothetical protein
MTKEDSTIDVPGVALLDHNDIGNGLPSLNWPEDLFKDDVRLKWRAETSAGNIRFSIGSRRSIKNFGLRRFSVV